ncbi:hypothetical protein AB5N19_03472 [Seiridium cardinale]|uniref:Fucose-specific lectin n=1 Tax=Seiridium cardinale TaxID=138064 RepID=A0ABR2Y276_9PEZI
MADHQQYEPSYSTLEVASPNSTQFDAASHAPEVAPSAYKDSTHDHYDDQHQAPEYTSNQSEAPEYVPPPTSKPATFCGLSRKAVWIITIIAVLAIGGLAGGLGGGLSTRNSGAATQSATPETPAGPDGNSTNSTGPMTGVLADSQIAAINWTDSGHVERRAVFYQKNGSLFYSQYHTANNSWTQFNVSAVFERELLDNALKVKPGTPLAVAAVSSDDDHYVQATKGVSSAFSLCLYFIDTDNHLREVYTKDYDLTVWVQGQLKNAALIAADNSFLGANAYYCPNTANCTDQFIAVYQGTDQKVMLAYGPIWESPLSVDTAYPGAPVAVIPIASDGGRNITDVSEMRVFYYSNGAFKYDYYNLYGLTPGQTALSSLSVVDNKVPQIVATPCDLNGHAFAAAMDGSGKFTASFYDYNVGSNDGWRMNQRVLFHNENGKDTEDSPDVEMTSITMDHSGYLYGIMSDGKSIASYTWSSETSKRFDFTWKEAITVD